MLEERLRKDDQQKNPISKIKMGFEQKIFLISNYTSDASNEIAAFSTLLTGQPALALAALSSNFSLVMPGIFAFKIRCEVVIVPLSMVTSAVTSSESAVKPAFCNSKLRAMAKQPECAAAMSSSGLVPTPSSNRDL